MKYPNHKFSVVGHSWGGFSTSNIANYHPDVAHVISFAPFISLSQILHQTFHGLLGGMYKHVYELECSYNGEYAESSAINALSNYKGHALIVHSKDDHVLKVKYHFNKIRKALKQSQNIEFLLVNKKRHNPNYTKEAVVLLDDFLKIKEQRIKEGKLTTKEEIDEFNNSFNWWKLTEQDPEIWNKVFEVLNK
jgi:dipeptidyl aminopeptidase/acylaminoacyl peptidase